MGVSLNSLMTEAQRKYTDLELDLADGTAARLRNLLLLEDGERKAAQELVAALDGSGDEDEQLRCIRDLLIAVADRPDAVREEIAGWPAVALVLIIERYLEDTQAGEASRSSS